MLCIGQTGMLESPAMGNRKGRIRNWLHDAWPGVLLVVVVACACWLPAAWRRARLARCTATERHLCAKITALDVANAPLTQLLDTLDRRGDLNMHVDWSALQEAGVSRSRIVSSHPPAASTYKDVLASILRDVEGSNPLVSWIDERGMLRVSTLSGLKRCAIVRQYDVAHLFRNVPDYSINDSHSGPTLD